MEIHDLLILKTFNLAKTAKGRLNMKYVIC